MRGSFPLFTSAYSHNNFIVATRADFLFLYLNNALSSKESWSTITGLRAGRFRVRIPLRAIDMFSETSVGLRGIFPRVEAAGGVTHNSPPSNATLRICGAVPPHPLHALEACIWTMRVEMQESKWQGDKETCKMWKLKLSFAIVVTTINSESWWARLAEWESWWAEWCGGWMCVPGW